MCTVAPRQDTAVEVRPQITTLLINQKKRTWSVGQPWMSLPAWILRQSYRLFAELAHSLSTYKKRPGKLERMSFLVQLLIAMIKFQ
jgi:hypothetical protein